MAEIEPLLQGVDRDETHSSAREELSDHAVETKPARVASLDVFRGLSVFLMMLVDYVGSIFPVIAHSPWNGVHLADFVMPFFLFVAGISVAIVHKRVPDKVEATWKVILRALKLFLLGVFLQGGYFHGANSLTYGVDIDNIRVMGILQRIAIGYIVAALCEIWLTSNKWKGESFVRKYSWQWFVIILVSFVYLALLYGLYVPDWQFSVDQPVSSPVIANQSYVYTVKCSVRGDLGPACNSAGMIDRYILGIDHLYQRPVYRNLKECNISSHGQVPLTSPSWCHAPFDPEGILSSLTAAVTCIIGLQYGHILVQLKHHGVRLRRWSAFSALLMGLGLVLALVMPLNKSLYTISYLMVTSASAGITFCLLYALVDVYGWRRLTLVLEWMGKHSLCIFILVTSNVIVIFAQGFYVKSPQNNVVHWIIARFEH